MKSRFSAVRRSAGTTLYVCYTVVLLLMAAPLSALDYYWVNGSGDWSDFATHWAKIPNPTLPAHYHANVPTADDDVFFGDTNGGAAYTVNVDAGSTVPKCRNMDWTGVPAGTVWGGGGGRMDIYGSHMMDANMSMTFNNEIHFISNDVSTKQIWSDGVHFSGTVIFEGTDGSWELSDDVYFDKYVYQSGGTLKTKSKTVTFGSYFQGSGKLQLEDSDVIFTEQNSYRFFYAPGDFDAGTSHIKIYPAGSDLTGASAGADFGCTFYDVTFFNSGIFGLANISGTLKFQSDAILSSAYFTDPPTINNLILEKNALIYCAFNYSNLTLAAGRTYTISGGPYADNGTDQTILPGGSLTALGAGTCSEFITIKSWQYGTHFNFVNNSGAKQTVHCVILEDCHATGSDPLEVLDGVDLGNNTGWIFTAPNPGLDLYWVGGDGAWNDPSHWSETDGGAPGACLPNGASNVHFTALSGFSSGDQVTVPEDAYCLNMDWTGVTGEPEFFQPSTSILNIYGSLKYATPTEMTTVLAHITNFRGSNIHTITTSGQLMGIYSIFEGSGEYRFADAFTSQKFIAHLRGKVKTMGYPVSIMQWFGSFNPFTYTLVDNSTAEVWFGDPILGVSSTVTFTNTLYPQDPTRFFNEYQSGKFHAMNSHIVMQAGPGNRIETRYAGTTHNYWKITMAAGAFERGNVLDKLTFTSRGNIDTYGDFNEVEFYENAVIRGNHSYNILTIRGSYFYQFLDYNGEGNTQTINAGGTINVLNADCEHLAYLNSGDPVTTAKIAKTGGALHLQHVILDNVLPDLTTGAIYSAGNSFGIQPQVTADWNMTNPASRNLFWVGGSGTWHDSNHWSLASGGAGGECPPTPDDNVRFDAASGLGAGSVVDVTQIRAFCKDMDWTGVTGGAKFYTVLPPYTPNQMTVFGSLTFSSGMENDFAGAFWMRAKGPATITSAGKQFHNNIYFWSPDGNWTLMDDLSMTSSPSRVNAVVHSYGSLNTNDKNVVVGGWNYDNANSVTTSASAVLTLGSSKLKISNLLYGNVGAFGFFYYSPGQFSSGTSEITFEAAAYSRLFAPGYTTEFYDVIFKTSQAYFENGTVKNKLLFEKDGGMSQYAGGDYSIHDLEFQDDAYFSTVYGTSSRDVHSIKLAPGKRYTFANNFTLNIVPRLGVEGQFIAQGLPGQYIEMKSSDPSVPATIHMDDYNGTSTCTKYLFLTGMTHTGTEEIYVPTPGGDVFNNSGWLFFPCNPCPATIPVLAANSITVGCAPGQAKLILDGLKPDEWAIWYTDPAAMTNIVYNGGTPGPAGNLFEPAITGPVTYYARVYSDGGLCESTVILSVDITITNPPAAFNVTGGGLVCAGSNGAPVGLDGSATGVSYQLQLDGSDVGAPLAGTGAALDFGLQTAPGTYTVVANPAGASCPATMTGSAVVTGSQNQVPAVAVSTNAPLCTGSGDLLLFESGGAATAWAWSGPGGFASADQNPVIANPTTANSGDYTVVVTDGNGCSDSQLIQIAIYPLPVVSCPADITTSLADAPFVLTGATPAGGDYSGTGVNLGVFYPATAGLGSHPIVYAISGVNCGNSCQFNIQVDAQVQEPTCPPNQVKCVLDLPLDLTTLPVTPTGGVFSGNGVTGNTFSAPAGSTNTITYTIGSGNSERDCKFDIEVFAKVAVKCPASVTVCLCLPPSSVYQLNSGTPTGGVYSGPAVVNGTINFDLMGSGPHVVTYTLHGDTDCSSSCSFTIRHGN